MDKRYFVDQLRVFAEMYNISAGEEILGEIVNRASFRVIPKGEIVSFIGDATTEAGLVLSGLIRCYYIDEDGNDITRGFAPEGVMCMDEGFFGYQDRICMWETLEETTIMYCKTADIRNLIKEKADFKDIWIYLLEQALRYKIYRENGFLLENAAERYIHFIKLYPNINKRVSQKHIATYLGIAPESLSRIRSAMKEDE